MKCFQSANIESFGPAFSKGCGSPEGKALGRSPQREKSYSLRPGRKSKEKGPPQRPRRCSADFILHSKMKYRDFLRFHPSFICVSKAVCISVDVPPTVPNNSLDCLAENASGAVGRLRPYEKPLDRVFHTFPDLISMKIPLSAESGGGFAPQPHDFLKKIE